MQKARKFVGLLLAVALVVAIAALTGCGQSQSSTPASTTGSSSTSVNLVPAAKPAAPAARASQPRPGRAADSAMPMFEPWTQVTPGALAALPRRAV